MTTTATTTTTATNAAADFIFFEGAASVSSSRARITIRRGGLITLTQAAVALLGQDVSSVQLAFNRKTGAVGIRAAAPGTPGSYRLRNQMKGAGRQITGKRFFLHFGLDLTAPARSFEVTDFGGGLIGFTFELKPAAPVEEVPAAAPATKPAADRPARSNRKAA